MTNDALDLDELVAQITLPTTGAACVFSGMVRGQDRARTTRTRPARWNTRPTCRWRRPRWRQVADEIRARWPAVEGIAIVQRIGRLEVGTPTVLIACTAGHRDTRCV